MIILPVQKNSTKGSSQNYTPSYRSGGITQYGVLSCMDEFKMNTLIYGHVQLVTRTK